MYFPVTQLDFAMVALGFQKTKAEPPVQGGRPVRMRPGGSRSVIDTIINDGTVILNEFQIADVLGEDFIRADSSAEQ